jgi:hypothetical protein
MDIRKHINIVAWLHIAFSSLLIFLGVISFVVLVGIGLALGDSEAKPILSLIGGIALIFFGLLASPGLIGGIFLLRRAPWARILVLIVGALNLLNIPIGTALGGYTIWVLAQRQTEEVLTSPKN